MVNAVEMIDTVPNNLSIDGAVMACRLLLLLVTALDS
jgi:hypothetical protein